MSKRRPTHRAVFKDSTTNETQELFVIWPPNEHGYPGISFNRDLSGKEIGELIDSARNKEGYVNFYENKPRERDPFEDA